MIQLGSAYGEIQIGTGDAERNVSSLASTMRKVGGTLTAAVSAPLIGVAAAGLSAAAGFEQSMNTIAVVSGATESAMTQLNAKALQLGRDTSFSAGEAAQGMLELSKAGLDASQTMDAISGVLDLAAAGGLSVAQAAEVSANALNAFKLPASEATRVANLLAAAANSSSMEVSDMALAFQASSAVFASNGQQIDDLSTAIALLANNGIKGSDAGTSLKTMLMRLAAPTDTAAAAMQALGVHTYNADGSMRSFEDIVGNLASATANLSAEQRNAAFTTIFGADAIRAANILVDEGAASYAEMRAKVNQAGAATTVAESKMKGLSGAIAYAKGTIESTLIAAFQPFLDTIGNLIRQGADLVGMFAALPDPVRNAALAFAAVMAAVGPLLLALPAIGGALGALLSPIGLIAVAVAGLAAAWVADFGGIRTATMDAWTAIQPTLARWAGLATDLWGAIEWIFTGQADNIDWWWDIAEAMGFTGDTAMQVGDAMYEAGVRIGNALTTIRDTFAAVWEQISNLFGPGITRIQEAFGELGGSVGELSPALEQLQAAFGQLWSALQPIIQAMIEGFSRVAQIWGGALVAGMVLGTNLIAAAIERLPDILNIVIEQIALTLETLATVIQESTTLITALLTGDWATAWSSASTIVQSVLTLISTMLGNFVQAAQLAFGLLADAIVATLTDLGIEIADPLDELAAYWADTWTAVQTAWETVWTAIAGAWGVVVSWLTGTFPTALEAAKNTFAEQFELIRQAVEQRINPILGLFQTVATWLESTLQTAFSAFQTFLQQFSLPNPFDSIAQAIKNVRSAVDALPAAFSALKDWLTGFSLPNPFAGVEPPAWMTQYLPGFATGSSMLPGGPVVVGERGPELLVSRPGDRILTNGQSNRLAAAGGTGGDTYNVTFSGPIYPGVDLREQARQFVREVQRMRR